MCVSVLLLTATGTRTGSDARTVAITVFVNRAATYIVTFRNIHTKLKDIETFFQTNSFLQRTSINAFVRKYM